MSYSLSPLRKKSNTSKCDDDEDLTCEEEMPDLSGLHQCLSQARATAVCRPFNKNTLPYAKIRGISERAQTMFNADPESFFKYALKFDSKIKVAAHDLTLTVPVELLMSATDDCPLKVNAYAKFYFPSESHDTERKIYECLVHNSHSDFFVFPICVGTIPNGFRNDHLKPFWDSYMLNGFESPHPMKKEYLELSNSLKKKPVNFVLTENCNPNSSSKSTIDGFMNDDRFKHLIVVQMYHALQVMRQNNICHGDLHPGNILFPEVTSLGFTNENESRVEQLYLNVDSGQTKVSIKNGDIGFSRLVKIFDWDFGQIIGLFDRKTCYLDTVSFVKLLVLHYNFPVDDDVKYILQKVEYWQDPAGERVKPNAPQAKLYKQFVYHKDIHKLSLNELERVSQFLENLYKIAISSIIRSNDCACTLSPFFVVRMWNGSYSGFKETFLKAYADYTHKVFGTSSTTGLLGFYDPGPDGKSLYALVEHDNKLVMFIKKIFVMLINSEAVKSLVTPHFVIEHANWNGDYFDKTAENFEQALERWREQRGESATLHTEHPASGRYDTIENLLDKHGIPEMKNADGLE